MLTTLFIAFHFVHSNLSVLSGLNGETAKTARRRDSPCRPEATLNRESWVKPRFSSISGGFCVFRNRFRISRRDICISGSRFRIYGSHVRICGSHVRTYGSRVGTCGSHVGTCGSRARITKSHGCISVNDFGMSKCRRHSNDNKKGFSPSYLTLNRRDQPCFR
jgi:hypothetical protein